MLMKRMIVLWQLLKLNYLFLSTLFIMHFEPNFYSFLLYSKKWQLFSLFGSICFMDANSRVRLIRLAAEEAVKFM